MTTIAIDRNGFIAADGFVLWGGEIRNRAQKKLRISNGVIYGLTGLTPLMDVLIEWHQKHEASPEKLPKVRPEEGWTLVVVDQSGIGKYTNTCPYIDRFDPPIAFGAGGDYAIGAMLAGATAAEAVKIVSDLCNHTGGEIQTINIAEALGLSDVQQAAE